MPCPYDKSMLGVPLSTNRRTYSNQLCALSDHGQQLMCLRTQRSFKRAALIREDCREGDAVTHIPCRHLNESRLARADRGRLYTRCPDQHFIVVLNDDQAMRLLIWCHAVAVDVAPTTATFLRTGLAAEHVDRYPRACARASTSPNAPASGCHTAISSRSFAVLIRSRACSSS